MLIDYRFCERGNTVEMAGGDIYTERDNSLPNFLITRFSIKPTVPQKKDENRRHKKKTGIDVINDNDDAIAKMIADMRQAARDDRALNAKGNTQIELNLILFHYKLYG